MLISVVIPAFNARDELRVLLRTLAHTVLDAGDSVEVIVADDGSTDGTGEMLSALSLPFPLVNVYLPRNDRSSRAAARNAAIARAGGAVTVMVDADQVVGPTFIREHVRYHRMRDDLVVVGPRPDLGDGAFDEELLAEEFSFEAMPPVAWADPRVALLTSLNGNLNQMATCWHLVWTCNVSVRTSHLRVVDGFDPAFLGWGLEDSELSYRLRQRGLAFAFNRAAVAYHQRSRRVDDGMFADWTANLTLMSQKHEVPEVALQSVIAMALNPTDRRLPWIEAARRFEHAARALAGRRCHAPEYHLVTVSAETTDMPAVIERLTERAATEDLVVVDETPGAALAGPVQCIDTDRELHYVHQPSREEWEAILDRLRIVA